MDAASVAAIRSTITRKYSQVAASPVGFFRYPTGGASALGLGYPPALVQRVPLASRDRFVGVGNPFALGDIHPGEAVLDVGCGAGFDVFVAAQRVGPAGRVAGMDLSPEMLAVAEQARIDANFAHVQFHKAAIEVLPFPDASFDVTLSNGVLSLIPDKPAALREIYRVLKPGGRLQICDIGLVGEGPPPDQSPWSD